MKLPELGLVILKIAISKNCKPKHLLHFYFKGSYECICQIGFAGTGTYCHDAGNCTEDTCERGVCEELTPGYR